MCCLSIHQDQTSGFSFRTTTLSLGMVKSRYRPSPLEWSNQHCIETLSVGLVIDSFTLRPSARQWSSISLHQDPLLWNGHWFSSSYRDSFRENGHRFLGPLLRISQIVVGSRPSTQWWSPNPFRYRPFPLEWSNQRCIETLSVELVIDSFTSRPSAKQWSLILFIASRPSARQWSSISLHQAPLLWNGHWFSLSHRGPLRGNGHRFLYIKPLSLGMVINSFTSRPSAKQWSLISWLHRDPLQSNGYLFLYIETLSLGMVESTHKKKIQNMKAHKKKSENEAK